MVLESHSEEETEALAGELARTLRPGDVLALEGELGAGKTAFTRGLAAGLGYPGRVTSPTFTVVNEYEGGRLPLFHFDMYRLEDAGALFDIGWEDYLNRGGVCCVEWSQRGGEYLSGARRVAIRRGPGETDRLVEIQEAAPC